eukprot:972301-Pelagomonas_calceolata.AAC.1
MERIQLPIHTGSLQKTGNFRPELAPLARYTTHLGRKNVLDVNVGLPQCHELNAMRVATHCGYLVSLESADWLTEGLMHSNLAKKIRAS